MGLPWRRGSIRAVVSSVLLGPQTRRNKMSCKLPDILFYKLLIVPCGIQFHHPFSCDVKRELPLRVNQEARRGAVATGPRGSGAGFLPPSRGGAAAQTSAAHS